MSERAGSVRDARFLSGADIGRTITARGEHAKIRGVTHWEHSVHVTISAGTVLVLDPNDAVTITGADN